MDTDAPGATVTAALADADGCATLCAVTVTPVDGTALGAVYIPEGEMVPTVGFPSTVPLTIQVTDVFVFPVTVALNC